MNTIHLKSWVSCAAFFGLLFTSTLAFAVAPIVVKMEVGTDSGGNKKLMVSPDGNSAPCGTDAADASKPCIEVAKNTAPFIKFRLPITCTGAEDDPNYELVDMWITMIEGERPTPDNPLYKIVAKDFKADPMTGEINFHSGKNKKSNGLLKLKNANSKAYTVFYQITASPCDDASDLDDIKLDPEIRNRGSS